MFLIAGATGNTGSTVADQLLTAGRKVRVLVRSEDKGAAFAKRGAEVAVGELGDVAALTRALDGVEAAYLLTPPNMAAEDFFADRARLNDRMAEAVKASGVPRVVYLSSVGAQLESGTGPILSVRDGDAKLAATGTRLTALRPAYFAENWGMVAATVKSDAVLPTFLSPEVRPSMVSTQDIGRVAAELLLDPEAPRVVELAGPVDLGAAEVAAAFSEVIGRPVTVAYAPIEQVVPMFASLGMPAVGPLYRDLYAAVNDGRLVFEKPEAVRRGTVGIAEVARKLLG
ncbi:MAG: NmrA family NAD(P)-binding protein [Polyangiaceae bacterium]